MKNKTVKPAQLITLTQALKEGNSSANQTIKGRFIGQHVYTCATGLVEYILSKGYEDRNAPFCLDDVENMYTNTEKQVKYIIDEQSTEDFAAHIEDEDGDTIWSIDAEGAQKLTEAGLVADFSDDQCVTDYLRSIKVISEYDTVVNADDDFETEPQEIYEYWIVSEYLYNKLKEYGQPVVTDGNLEIWGRTCSGQAILLDYVITKICANMEILEGQSNSWA